MKKVLYLDFLYPNGHIRQNTTYINYLSEIAKVYVLSPKGRYDKLPPEVELIEKDSLSIKDGKILNRLSSLNIMILSAILARKLKPEYIFVSTYDTLAFAVGRFFFRKQDKLFLLQHFNIDELENSVKRLFFMMYMRKVEYIVFEEFIKKYLVETFRLNEKRIHVLPHQLNENLTKINKIIYSCVGLSNSNDEKLVSEIIDIEKREELLRKAGSKVVLKSKCMEFDNGFLRVIKGYLSNGQYNDYINNSQCIYMPFPSSFRYRMSGTLVDALSNNKMIFGSNIPLIHYFASQYPDVCKIINSAEEFFHHTLNTKSTLTDEQIKNFEQFKIIHSAANIKEVLKMLLN